MQHLLLLLADSVAQCAHGVMITAGTAPDDDDNFDVDPMHLIMWRIGHEAEQPVWWSRGFAIPYPDDWLRMSLSPQQLRAYSACLETRSVRDVWQA